MSFAGLTDEDRKGLQTTSAQQKGYSCPTGAYCSPQAGTNVSGSTRPIFHRTTTTLVRDSSNKVTGSKTEVYILSDGNWVIAATSTDKGKTYTFNEGTRSDGSKIVGAGLRQSFAPGGNMNKNVKKQVSDTLRSGGAELVKEKKLTPKELSDAGYPEASPEQNGDNSKPPDLTELQKATAADETKTRTSFPNNLIYPIDIGSTKQDVIQFEMLQYKPRGYSAEKGLAGVGERDSNRSAIGRVILPIPSGISDQNGVTWGQESLNPGEALAANLALSTITRGFGAGGNVLTSAAGQIQESSDEAKTLAAAAFASAATGIGQQLLTRTTGAIVNSNLELLFREPTLRPFSFTFKMSARSDEEAKMIIKIIRFFKQGMAVQRSKSNLFLKSPHTFRIKYKYRGQNGGEHKYIGKIKECALQNFNVSYTPEGQYATFEDGVLVSYEIQMSFTELEPVFNDDYTGLDGNADTEIGY